MKKICCLLLFLTGLVFITFNYAAAQTEKNESGKNDIIQNYISSGNKFISENDYKNALEEYKKALALDEQNAEVNYKVGVAYYLLKNYKEAASYFNKTIQNDSQNYKAYNNLGLIYAKDDQYVEASLLYRKAIEIKPDYQLAHYNLVVALYKRDRLDEAEQAAQALVKIDAGYDKAYYLLGLIKENNEKYEEAENFYLKALAINSRNTEAQSGLKRVKTFFKMDREKKEALAQARAIISFKLPPDYEFVKVTDLKESAAKVIAVKYKNEQDFLIISFSEKGVLDKVNVKDISQKPEGEIAILLEKIKIVNLVNIDPKSLNVKENNEDNSEKLDMASFECKMDDVDSAGIMSIVADQNNPENRVLFIGIAPKDKFLFSTAFKFLKGVGTPTKSKI